MRSRVMVRKVDRLPEHFPIFEDLATPVGLMNKLEPNAKITRIEGFEKLINRNAYILLLPYYSVYENPHRFCHSRRIFSG
jgi:hypothetical protein